MASTRTNNYKNFEADLQAIRWLGDFNGMAATITGNEKCTAALDKSEKGFRLQIDGVFHEREAAVAERLEIYINGCSYLLKSADLAASSVHADILAGVHATHTYTIQGIQSCGFPTEGEHLYRSFYPVPPERLKDFIFIAETIPYENETTVYGYDCIRIAVNEKVYDIVRAKSDGRGYYIIENQTPESYDEYAETCFAIRQAMGFLTGYMPGGEEYVFCSNRFSYSSYTRPGLHSLYYPVNSNSYAKLSHKKDEAEKYYGKLNKIPASVFSRLATLIRQSGELSATVILLLEAASVRSLLLIPAVFSVVIESLSKQIGVPSHGTAKPVSDTELEAMILSDISGVLDAYQPQLDDNAFLTLKRRVPGITRPVVMHRLTNNEKLTAPFEYLGITLTLADITAIEHRNDLLHGNVLLQDGAPASDNEINAYMAFVAGKLYTLISKLLLKYAGYSGYVINYAKFYKEEDNEERYYDEI
jgi:hypothetical protein